MPFEINHPLHGLLNGTIDTSIIEVGGVNPTSILEGDKDFEVHVKWTLSGPLTPFVAGSWHVNLYFEAIGPGVEPKVPAPAQTQIVVPLAPAPSPNNYSATVTVPAGTLEATKDSRPYLLVVTVTYRTVLDKPGPMAAFRETRMLQVYRDDV